ncbi:MAG: SH3 domain-containing protein [Bacteroidota bacterium]
MTKKKDRKGLLPGIELIIIGAFVISILVVTIPQCDSTQEQYRQEAIQLDTLTAPVEPKRENFLTPPPPEPETTTPAISSSTTTAAPKRLPLYITIDQINMRDEPNIMSRVIRKLDLHEKVYYEGETTEKKKEIDWGDGIVTNEPWVKVRTLKDEIGWVYGAGVHFYEKAFPLPQEESMNNEQ